MKNEDSTYGLKYSHSENANKFAFSLTYSYLCTLN